jgi:hypothetical protein
MMELVGERELLLSILRWGEPVLRNVVYATYKPHLGVWHADWVFGVPGSTVNNVK